MSYSRSRFPKILLLDMRISSQLRLLFVNGSKILLFSLLISLQLRLLPIGIYLYFTKNYIHHVIVIVMKNGSNFLMLCSRRLNITKNSIHVIVILMKNVSKVFLLLNRSLSLLLIYIHIIKNEIYFSVISLHLNLMLLCGLRMSLQLINLYF